MKSKNYYKILEVTSHADKITIKKAYQRLARKFHPDISVEPDAEHRFKEINEAYDVLKDSHKRFIYDSANFKLVTSHSYSWFIAKKTPFLIKLPNILTYILLPINGMIRTI